MYTQQQTVADDNAISVN